MNAQNAASQIFLGAAEIADPGTTKSIIVDESPVVVPLVSVAAETRTLARPTRAGAIVTLHHRTDGGDITVTVTGGYNEADSTTIVLTDAGQFYTFLSLYDGTSYFWRLISSHNVPAGDSLGQVIAVTSSTLTITEAIHNNKIMALDLAAGIAITLPAAKKGLRFRFVVQTTFTGAASIKSVAGADIMIGHALMGNNSDNTVVDWPALASNTFDTINLFGTSNSTGGIEGQEIEIIGLATNKWFVSIRGDAAGSEATPFEDTVT